jgi:hypothetical protein
MATTTKPDAYCTFTNDVERRNALIARDVRLVLVFAIVFLGGAPPAWRDALRLIRTLLA